MRKFTAAEVQAIIEADRSGRIHLEPRDYTETTLAAALKQYRDLPMVGAEAHPGYQHAWGKNDLCIYKGCKAGPAEFEAERQAARAMIAEMGKPEPAEPEDGNRFVQIQKHRQWKDFEPCGLDDVVGGVRRVTLVDGGGSDYLTLENYETENVDRYTARAIIETGHRPPVTA